MRAQKAEKKGVMRAPGPWRASLRLARPAALAMGAALLAGAGIVVDGDATTLPVSPAAGLPTMTPTPGEVMQPGEAGLIWHPDAGPDAGAPDAGPPPQSLYPACGEIRDRIAHRRGFLRGVGDMVVQVGYAMATQAYCEQHPEEVECARPPTAAERDISEDTIQGQGDAPPEADAWIVRWKRELARCQAEVHVR